MRTPLRFGISALLLITGMLALHQACAHAMLNLPSSDQLPAYRVVFYRRAVLGIGCIVLAAIVIRRRTGRSE